MKLVVTLADNAALLASAADAADPNAVCEELFGSLLRAKHPHADLWLFHALQLNKV